MTWLLVWLLASFTLHLLVRCHEGTSRVVFGWIGNSSPRLLLLLAVAAPGALLCKLLETPFFVAGALTGLACTAFRRGYAFSTGD